MTRGLFFIIIICFGCRQGDKKPTDSKNDLTDNKSLIQLLQKLPTIKTPVTFHSSKKIERTGEKDYKLIESIFSKIPGFNAYGKLVETDKIIAVIGIVPADKATPMLLTFDLNGNQLDSLFMYRSAGESMGLYSKNIVTIISQYEFSLTDSTLTRKLNEDETNEIEGTDSLTVTKEQFRITDKGVIEKVR
jgi:hypothetical protein